MSQPEFVGDAEKLFRDAFDRLKRGTPVLLPKGTAVSQNNVAKEAGRDPSALRKTRYPRLVRSIQKWIGENGDSSRAGPSSAKLLKGAREKNRQMQARIAEVTGQRDKAMTKLVIAEERILELTRELEHCRQRLGESRSVVPIGRPGKAAPRSRA